VIRYKKSASNKVVDMLSHPPISAFVVFQNVSLSLESYVEQYANDSDFKEIYAKLTRGPQVDNYYLQGNLLYHLGKLCILSDERVHVIREAHTSLVSGHFGIEKTLCHLQRFCFWPHMKNIVTRFVKGCVLCSISKPSNRKLGVYTPSYMQMYSVVNVENLKLYEPLMIPTVDDFAPKYLDKLPKDIILDQKTRTSRQGDVEYIGVGFKGIHPSKA